MSAKKAEKISRPRQKRVTFQIKAGPKSDVYLAGSFNAWDSSSHRLSRKSGNGTYTTTLLLPVGRYEYKFVVDSEWRCDPAGTAQVTNEHGTLNSVLEVR